MAPLWRDEGLEPARYAGAFDGLYIDLASPSFAWEQPLGESVRLRPVLRRLASGPRGSTRSRRRSST